MVAKANTKPEAMDGNPQGSVSLIAIPPIGISCKRFLNSTRKDPALGSGAKKSDDDDDDDVQSEAEA
jgi:hypothetical protein